MRLRGKESETSNTGPLKFSLCEACLLLPPHEATNVQFSDEHSQMQFLTKTEYGVRAGRGCEKERMPQLTEPKMFNLLNGRGGMVKALLQGVKWDDPY